MPGGDLQNDDGKSHAETFGEVEQQQETGGQPDIPRGVGGNVLTEKPPRIMQNTTMAKQRASGSSRRG